MCCLMQEVPAVWAYFAEQQGMKAESGLRRGLWYAGQQWQLLCGAHAGVPVLPQPPLHLL